MRPASREAYPTTFDLFAVRFHFRAKDSIRFPPGKPGNVLRGAFGATLHASEDYQRIFRPTGQGPSGLHDRPRPFVFRAAHLDGITVAPGERFYFDMHWFFPERPPVESFELRGAALVSMESSRVSVALEPQAAPVPHVLVRFLTPTELKSGEHIAERPEFPILLARIRDRVSTLRALYGGGPIEIDFRGMRERASGVRMTRCEIRHVRAERRSAGTGQTHPLGGFTGLAEYEGELAEFLPYLQAAKWTGVGRQTVWGKGAIEVEI